MEQQFDYLKKLPDEPGNLIRGLQLIQATEGYVSDEAIRAAAEYFHQTPLQFYVLFLPCCSIVRKV